MSTGAAGPEAGGPNLSEIGGMPQSPDIRVAPDDAQLSGKLTDTLQGATPLPAAEALPKVDSAIFDLAKGNTPVDGVKVGQMTFTRETGPAGNAHVEAAPPAPGGTPENPAESPPDIDITGADQLSADAAAAAQTVEEAAQPIVDAAKVAGAAGGAAEASPKGEKPVAPDGTTTTPAEGPAPAPETPQTPAEGQPAAPVEAPPTTPPTPEGAAPPPGGNPENPAETVPATPAETPPTPDAPPAAEGTTPPAEEMSADHKGLTKQQGERFDQLRADLKAGKSSRELRAEYNNLAKKKQEAKREEEAKAADDKRRAEIQAKYDEGTPLTEEDDAFLAKDEAAGETPAETAPAGETGEQAEENKTTEQKIADFKKEAGQLEKDRTEKKVSEADYAKKKLDMDLRRDQLVNDLAKEWLSGEREQTSLEKQIGQLGAERAALFAQLETIPELIEGLEAQKGPMAAELQKLKGELNSLKTFVVTEQNMNSDEAKANDKQKREKEAQVGRQAANMAFLEQKINDTHNMARENYDKYLGVEAKLSTITGTTGYQETLIRSIFRGVKKLVRGKINKEKRNLRTRAIIKKGDF